MDKEQISRLVQRYNENTISKEELIFLEKAIEEGMISLEDLKSLDELDKKMDFSIPEPSPNLKERFYQGLAAEKSKLARGNFFTGLSMWLTDLGWSQSAIRLAYSITLMVVGVGIGFWINGAGTSEAKIDALTEQVSEMREMMLLTLIKEPVATERLRAINLVTNAPKVDVKVVDALLNTLNNDENNNVRLATVEVLIKYAKNPKVRKGLVESIPNQSSSLIQYALAEAMVIIGEKSSVKSLNELLNKEGLDDGVKEKIKESIQKLI